MNNKGFTLIEIVMTMVIVVILAGIAAVIILQGVKSYTSGEQRSDTHFQTRLAVERMAREARSVRGCSDLVSSLTPTNALSFTDMNGNAVAFRVSGGNLNRGADVLATGITSLTPFSFLASDLTATTACPGIWFIEIDLSGAQGAETLQMRTRVHPRNF